MAKLDGKICVVTAAAQGIGKATAEMMAREGAQVFAADINAEALSALKSVRPIVLDVTDRRQIEALAQTVGTADALFNCAGFVHCGAVTECSEDDWDFSFDLNVKSMYRMIRAFLPGMIKAGGGAIVNMSSVASSVKGVRNRFAYSASKAAVIGLTKSVAVDFVDKGVRCNAVCPGTVDSPSLRERLRASGNYNRAMEEFVARQPMGRLARADEIAALVVYLAGDDAGFVTGQAYIIDGGWTA